MKRLFLLATLIASLTSLPAFAQPLAPDKAKIVAAAREVIGAVPYASFITVGAQGQANARIVQPAPPDAKFEIWIVTLSTSRKAAELRKNPRATLLYFDQAKMAYVTLLGTTAFVDNLAEKEKHWLPAWAPFFADGARTPNVVLVRFVPNRVEVVSPAHKLMGDMWTMAVTELP